MPFHVWVQLLIHELYISKWGLLFIVWHKKYKPNQVITWLLSVCAYIVCPCAGWLMEEVFWQAASIWIALVPFAAIAQRVDIGCILLGIFSTTPVSRTKWMRVRTGMIDWKEFCNIRTRWTVSKPTIARYLKTSDHWKIVCCNYRQPFQVSNKARALKKSWTTSEPLNSIL